MVQQEAANGDSELLMTGQGGGPPPTMSMPSASSVTMGSSSVAMGSSSMGIGSMGSSSLAMGAGSTGAYFHMVPLPPMVSVMSTSMTANAMEGDIPEVSMETAVAQEMASEDGPSAAGNDIQSEDNPMDSAVTDALED